MHSRIVTDDCVAGGVRDVPAEGVGERVERADSTGPGVSRGDTEGEAAWG